MPIRGHETSEDRHFSGNFFRNPHAFLSVMTLLFVCVCLAAPILADSASFCGIAECGFSDSFQSSLRTGYDDSACLPQSAGTPLLPRLLAGTGNPGKITRPQWIALQWRNNWISSVSAVRRAPCASGMPRPFHVLSLLKKSRPVRAGPGC